MAWYLPYVPEGEGSDIRKQLQDRRREVANHYSDYCHEVESGLLEEAIQTKREYQLARFKQRQVEGELFWVVLGHAIKDIAEDAEPEDNETEERGEELSEWAIEAEELETIESREKIELLIVRRFPSAPKPHRPYIKSMFELSQNEITNTRETDRSMLANAGWERSAKPSGEFVTGFDCPHCGGVIVIRSPNPKDVTLLPEFDGSDTVIREICPHCDTDVYVERSPEQSIL